ncbi:proline dehydrogenase [Exophiala dermatitidis]|uniref:Proline dehydrogenase n=1 Tax=Exophiala dermatitidis TaxID=5970 RepID=A0AAN6EN33_EXODE|nr:proline dehydrogenase [Exophiala dermatitidis]KAJ4545100.1 proline dehydrogenase [Exophiala dermatitidis]KAJ4554721.1 proline dehydrogenase [Exophiala dermatitidis]KAJ4561920.1 proline dehydrogenase [Exophiala dermatitidis]KAJ4563932.1 proline dehydrogenase [Exophiala dermatitidis]
MKNIGFAGIILCYGREAQAGKEKNVLGPASEANPDQQILEWRDGTLRTLGMIESSNFLGIRLTGAGTGVIRCLLEGSDPPPLFRQAMDAICRQAAAQGSRVWIDSEQQAVQSTIDKWTIDLMRRYNTCGRALVYNTLQAYRKASRAELEHQLRLSQQDGWTLAVKLVRVLYNGIVRDLLLGTVDGIPQDEFPPLKLFLATHNTETVRQTANLAKRLSDTGQLKVAPEFGQLQGMADDIGFEIIHSADAAKSTIEANTEGSSGVHGTFVPLVYKCLTWGSLRECMRYLVRRAEGNMGATGRLKEGLLPIVAELWHRSMGSVRRQGSGS